MADSIRKQILDAYVTALTASTGISYVSSKIEPWWDWDVSRFPAVCVIDGNENRSRFAYLHPTSEDMYSDYNITVIGYQYDQANDLETKRTDLVRDIEKAIQLSTAINDLTLGNEIVAVETDQGWVDNFSITHCKFVAKYAYNHATP